MATNTPTIALKKPDGSDPFLTQDFDDNYDKIDLAIKNLQDAVSAGGGGGGGGTSGVLTVTDTSTLDLTLTGAGTTASPYVLSGVTQAGPGGAFTQAQGDARYIRTVNGTGPDGAGNVTVAAGGATYPKLWEFSAAPGTTLSTSSPTNFTLGTITPPANGKVHISLYCEFSIPAGSAGAILCQTFLGGSVAGPSGAYTKTQYGSTSTPLAVLNYTHLGYGPVSTSPVSLTFQITSGGTGNILRNYRALVLFGQDGA